MPRSTPEEVRLRLLRHGDEPHSNPRHLRFAFGLQDTKGVVRPGARQADGALVFDFTLQVKPAKDAVTPLFTGLFASGPVTDRSVYLSWWALDEAHWINRVKARLGSIDWNLIHAAREKNARIFADMTGWAPGDPRKFVGWRLG